MFNSTAAELVSDANRQSSLVVVLVIGQRLYYVVTKMTAIALVIRIETELRERYNLESESEYSDHDLIETCYDSN